MSYLQNMRDFSENERRKKNEATQHIQIAMVSFAHHLRFHRFKSHRAHVDIN